MNRRKLLSWLGLGAGAATAEVVVGPAYLNAGYYPPQAVGGFAGPARYRATERVGAMMMDPRVLDELAARHVAAIEREREFLVTDVGGAL